MLPITRQISKYNHYDYNNPEFISIHYVGAQSSTAKNNADYFCGGDRQASAHYFVDNTSIYQVVEDFCGSWAVGNTRTEVNNQNSLSIEMCCLGSDLMVTEQTEANTVELVKYLMGKYGIPIANVRTHYTISGNSKICPNWSANGWIRFENFKKKIQNISVTPNPSKPTNDVIYRVKLANGEQIGAFRNLDSAKSLAQVNKCNVYRSTDNALIVSYVVGNPATKPINYRVKRKNGEQLGAFGSLDNAKSLAEKEKAIVYDANGNIVVSYVVKEELGYVNLKAHMTSWNVYCVDGPYTYGNEVGKLSPSKFGGLSYKILEKKANDVYKIKTESFGLVAIYVPRDNDSTFTSTPVYGDSNNTTQSTPQGKESRYAENGVFTFNTAVQIRTQPCDGYETGLSYYAGEQVTYHHVILNKNGFNWIEYARNNGTTGYLKVKDLSSGESYGYAK